LLGGNLLRIKMAQPHTAQEEKVLKEKGQVDTCESNVSEKGNMEGGERKVQNMPRHGN